MYNWSSSKCLAIGACLVAALVIVCVTSALMFHDSALTDRRDDLVTEVRIEHCQTLPTEAIRADCIEHAR